MDFDFTYSTQQVLVFRTNVNTLDDIRRVAPLLNSDERIQKWNLALDDCDKVLRIISDTLSEEHIIYLMRRAGYDCEELND